MTTDLVPWKVLLKHPEVEGYTDIPVKADIIQFTLGSNLAFPPTNRLSRIISCFALSLDGKLAYPNSLRGYNIALDNHAATRAEKKADSFTLALGRCISDAVIVGSGTLRVENGNYLPLISIQELAEARNKNSKAQYLTTIIFCRTLQNLNFNDEIFANPAYPVIVVCLEQNINFVAIPKNYQVDNFSTLVKGQMLQQKIILILDKPITEFFHFLASSGIKTILNESPFVHHYLLEQQFLDELWLNYSCSYIGGQGVSLGDKQNSFTTTNHPDSQIISLYHIDYHFLYSRQKIIYPNSNTSNL